MLEYGDSRDSYLVNKSQYESELNIARQYAHQKVWPRAIYVRRARSEYADCCFTRDSLTHFIQTLAYIIPLDFDGIQLNEGEVRSKTSSLMMS